MASLIGTGANQVPVNGLLGDMAFQNQNAVVITGGRISAQALAGLALADYVDDAAAAAGGVMIGGLYRTASIMKIRIV